MAKRLVAIGLAIPLGASAQAATRNASPIITASVRSLETGKSGAGFLMRYGEQCILVTAGHVVEDAVDVEVETSNQPLATARQRTLRTGLDVAVLPLTRPAASCPVAPGEAAVAQAAQGEVGTLVVGLPGGGSTSTSVRIIKANPDSLVIAPTLATARLAQGTSGGVLVMAGIPVAIQSEKSVVNGTLKAIRLDYAARVLGPSVLALAADRPAEKPAVRQAAQLPPGYIRLAPDDPRFTASVSMEPVGHATFGFTTQITLRVRIAAPPGQHIAILSGASKDGKFMDEWTLTTSAGECHAAASSAAGLSLVRSVAERDAATPMIVSDKGATFLANFTDCRFGNSAAGEGSLRIRILQKSQTGWLYGFFRGDGLRFGMTGAFGM